MSRSIVWPIVLLVLAAVTIASLVQFAITFNGPPPFTPPTRIDQIVEALKTGKARHSRWSQLRVEEGAHPATTGEPSPERDALIARAMGVPADQIRGHYDRPVIRSGSQARPRFDRASLPPAFIFGEFTVIWTGPQGARTVHSPPRPWLTDWHKVTLAATLAVLIVLGLGAWLIARAISHPIRNLARIARETRLGTRTPIPQQGPREVRELAAALDAMQARILEQAEGRTTMLAAIAHDMGTPITRLAFWIEQLPEAARDRANADIDEIRAMLASVLRFARDERADARDRIELGSLIESLVEDMKAAGTPVDAEAGPRVVIRGDSPSLRRLFANLIENAVRYGKVADIAWRAEPGWAEVIVDDRGPGFPDNADSLFTPFVRGEASRNRATGGTGLGLAIVRSIAEAHGGAVTLETREGGGGRVRVRLPAETAIN
ncbi:ATP-binding protein [Sphingomonas sp. LB-2]|uniref:sensor histidine kinase n=1 Tax=Sphingomonas caeni TaxID=2984949 RepID=UPI00222E4CFB|nr:ATP-binding protein [Sphingomonas caeni]MCW3845628.1 ATP-binding protein [Sphingomonas caeni]